MAEIWNEYWWGILIVLFYLHATFSTFGLGIYRSEESKRVNDEIRQADQLEDDIERVKRKSNIEPVNNKWFDAQYRHSAIVRIAFLLYVVIFLLVAIYMKL